MLKVLVKDKDEDEEGEKKTMDKLETKRITHSLDQRLY